MNRLAYHKHYLYLSIVFFSLAASVVITVFLADASQGSVQLLALGLLGLVCTLPAIWANLRGRLDPFEPIYAFALCTLVYFVFVPAVLVWQQAFVFLGVDYSDELGRVTAFAFLAFLGFSIGYYWQGRAAEAAHRPLAAAVPPEPALRRFMFRWALLLFTFFTLLVVAWILVAQFPLYTLWIFGDASYGESWTLATGPQIGYLYGAREALPACLLLLIAFRARRRWPLPALVLLLLLVLFFAGSGARFRVLLLVLGVVIFFFLERGKRPRTWQSVLIAFAIFYLVIGGVGFYRSQSIEGGRLRGRVLGQDVLTLDAAWGVMLGSSQIAVSTGVLVYTVPKYQSYFWGASFANVVTQPIPRFLWPGKPETIGQDFFSHLWPPGTTVPFWALFYLNFGPIGIVVGMAIWGWISRSIYDAYRRHPGNALVQVQLAVYWPFLIHMYGRGGDNFAFNFYGLIAVLLPVWLLMWLQRWWQSTRSRWPSLRPGGQQGRIHSRPYRPWYDDA